MSHGCNFKRCQRVGVVSVVTMGCGTGARAPFDKYNFKAILNQQVVNHEKSITIIALNELDYCTKHSTSYQGYGNMHDCTIKRGRLLYKLY